MTYTNPITSGVLYGVGVGPGDPELLTLKAVRTIAACPVIALPSKDRASCHAFQIVAGLGQDIEKSCDTPPAEAGTVSDAVCAREENTPFSGADEITQFNAGGLDGLGLFSASRLDELGINLADKHILELDFPMTRDELRLEEAHRTAFSRIRGHLVSGRDVAFLTIGDPALYSSYLYMHRLALAEGYRAEMIPGVTSIAAAAATLGIPLADFDEEIHIIPGNMNVREALRLSGCLIFMKSGRKLMELRNALAELMREETPEIYVASDVGMAGERLGCGLEALQEELGYLTLVIVKKNSRKPVKATDEMRKSDASVSA